MSTREQLLAQARFLTQLIENQLGRNQHFILTLTTNEGEGAEVVMRTNMRKEDLEQILEETLSNLPSAEYTT